MAGLFGVIPPMHWLFLGLLRLFIFLLHVHRITTFFTFRHPHEQGEYLCCPNDCQHVSNPCDTSEQMIKSLHDLGKRVDILSELADKAADTDVLKQALKSLREDFDSIEESVTTVNLLQETIGEMEEAFEGLQEQVMSMDSSIDGETIPAGLVKRVEELGSMVEHQTVAVQSIREDFTSIEDAVSMVQLLLVTVC